MGWGPVEWVGRVLPKANFKKKNAPRFLIFLDLSDRCWDICKKRCLGTSWMGWGPVEWVGRVFPEAKLKNKWTLFFLIFLIWATDTEISVKKQCLGTSWMGWGPVDWVGRVLPEAKFENKWTLYFYFFYLSDHYWPEIGNPKVLPTDWLTDQRTGVGSRDTCMSKKFSHMDGQPKF